MKIIAAVDILGAEVVRGVAGNRGDYKPIQSRLCAGARPLDVIRALREKCGVEEFYIADLDAILGRSGNTWLYEELAREGISFWLDAGSKKVEDLAGLESLGVKKHVVGMETWSGLKELQVALDQFGPAITFSLDLKQGEFLCPGGVWKEESPFTLIDTLAGIGLQQLLVLDLAQVGRSQGVGTLPLIVHARKVSQSWSILAGGGVRSKEDLAQLAQTGASGCLVASALHDQALTREDVLESGRL